MNECRRSREWMSAALDQAPSPEEKAGLERHLAGCPACRRDFEALRETRARIREGEPLEPPAWLAGRILGRVRGGAPAPGPWSRLRPFLLRPPLQVAALLLVCGTSYYLLRSQRGAAPVQGPSADQVRSEAPAAPPAPSPSPRPPAPPRAPKAAEPKAAGERLDTFAPAPPVEGTPAPLLAPLPAPAAGGGPTKDAEGASARAKAREEAAPTAQAAPRAASAEAGTEALVVLWEPREAARAPEDLERIFADLGIVPSIQPRLRTFRIEGRRLPELLARLERRGRILRAPAGPPPGPCEVVLRW